MVICKYANTKITKDINAERRHHVHQCLITKAWTDTRYRENTTAEALTPNIIKLGSGDVIHEEIINEYAEAINA